MCTPKSITPDLPGDYSITYPVTVTLTTLSCICTIVIVTCYVAFKQERNTIRQLIMALSIGDSLTSGSDLVGSFGYIYHQSINSTQLVPESNSTETYFCITQSFFSCTGKVVSILYNIAIPVYFYVVATKGYERVDRIQIWWVHAVFWSISLLISAAAVAEDALGPSYITFGPWCWISGAICVRRQILWMALTSRAWEILAFICAPLLYYIGCYDLHKKRRANNRPFAPVKQDQGLHIVMLFREEDRIYLLIPPLFYILRIWGTVRYILYSVELTNGAALAISHGLAEFLHIMQCLGYSQAIFNFIIFCFMDTTIRKKIIKTHCINRHQNELEPLIYEDN